MWKIALTRSLDEVSGNISLDGSNVLWGGAVQGTMDSSGIVLGIMAGDALQATFKGSLEGNQVRGEWECDAIQDSGVWFGTLTDGAGKVVQGE